MNYFELVTNILNIAKKHKYIQEVYYGDIYEFENLPNRRYSNFVLSVQNNTTYTDTTTYTFNAFVTDRLTDDKSNTIEVQSLSKTILEQILSACFDSLDSTTYTFWTEKFNDLCAGCYVTFSVTLPKELICADDTMFNEVVKEINENGTYYVGDYDKVVVDVHYPVVQEMLYAGYKYAYSSITDLNEALIFPSDCSYMFAYCSKLVNCDLSNANTNNITNISYMFAGCSNLTNLDISNFDFSKLTSYTNPFVKCSNLLKLNVENWDVSGKTITSLFANTYLTWLDLSKWTPANVRNLFNGSTNIKTIIGNHTLDEVRNGEVVCFEGCTRVDLDGLKTVRYSSVLACLKGMNNISENFWLPLNCYNNCYNDDDTVPDATTLAERQAEIAAICAEKNKHLQLG